MNILRSSIRSWLYWLVPIAVLALLILWQVDWGRAFVRVPPVESGIAPQPLTLAVLPVYEPAVTPDAARDAVERTLFNPTRRPAPAAVAEAAKPRIQRGQFALAGTLMVDGKATALLRETSGGKSRRVAQGETVNGMMVAEIRPDRVRLTLGDESEELALKLAVGPRTTIQPVVAGTAGGPISATAPPPGQAECRRPAMSPKSWPNGAAPRVLPKSPPRACRRGRRFPPCPTRRSPRRRCRRCRWATRTAGTRSGRACTSATSSRADDADALR